MIDFNKKYEWISFSLLIQLLYLTRQNTNILESQSYRLITILNSSFELMNIKEMINILKYYDEPRLNRNEKTFTDIFLEFIDHNHSFLNYDKKVEFCVVNLIEQAKNNQIKEAAIKTISDFSL